MLAGRGGKEGGERNKEGCDWEYDGGGLQAGENTVTASDRWKDEELDRHAENPVKGKEKADTVSLQALTG